MQRQIARVMEENQLLIKTVRSSASANYTGYVHTLWLAYRHQEDLLPAFGNQPEGTPMSSQFMAGATDLYVGLWQIEGNFRVDMSGFLFLYQPLSAGWFSSPWVRHYVSLTGTLLSYSLSPKASESPMTPCTRVSVEVKGRSCLNHALQCTGQCYPQSPPNNTTGCCT